MYETAAQPLSPNPWATIWTDPRATIRHLVRTDPERYIVLLAALGGIMQSLSQAMDRGMGDTLSLPWILLFAVGIGSVFGVVALYVGSWLVHRTGRWIGGEGSLEHIRTAVAWGNVPLVAGLALTVAVIATVGSLPFLSEEATAAAEVGMGGALILLAYGVTMIVFGIWSLVITVKGVGEVQGFSAWKGLGNVLLAGTVILVPIIAFGILAAILIPAMAGA